MAVVVTIAKLCSSSPTLFHSYRATGRRSGHPLFLQQAHLLRRGPSAPCSPTQREKTTRSPINVVLKLLISIVRHYLTHMKHCAAIMGGVSHLELPLTLRAMVSEKSTRRQFSHCGGEVADPLTAYLLAPAITSDRERVRSKRAAA